MGQISLPVLNRTGYSMFWQSVWDDKLNYNRNWKEDHVIRKIIPYVFLKRWTKNWRFYTSKIIKNSIILEQKNTFQYFAEPIEILQTIVENNREKKETLNYVLRVWIIKFQKYIIIYVHLYTPKQVSFKPIIQLNTFNKAQQIVNFLYFRFLNKINKKYFKETLIVKEQF